MTLPKSLQKSLHTPYLEPEAKELVLDFICEFEEISMQVCDKDGLAVADHGKEVEKFS